MHAFLCSKLVFVYLPSELVPGALQVRSSTPPAQPPPPPPPARRSPVRIRRSHQATAAGWRLRRSLQVPHSRPQSTWAPPLSPASVVRHQRLRALPRSRAPAQQSRGCVAGSAPGTMWQASLSAWRTIPPEWRALSAEACQDEGFPGHGGMPWEEKTFLGRMAIGANGHLGSEDCAEVAGPQYAAYLNQGVFWAAARVGSAGRQQLMELSVRMCRRRADIAYLKVNLHQRSVADVLWNGGDKRDAD